MNEIDPPDVPSIANGKSPVKKVRSISDVPAGDKLDDREKTENAAQRFFNQIALRRSSRNRTRPN